MDKKSKLLALGLGAMAALSISSCQDYAEFTEGQIKQDLYNKQYDEAFIKQFGQPDPNHKWGMDEEIGVIEGLSALDTRAGTTDVNRNQWTSFGSKKDSIFPNHGTGAPTVKVPVFNTSALGHDILIPGFPHLNGLYYTANGNVQAETKKGDEITSGMIPAGDVTPYEIQYVSNWFRTHKITDPKKYRINLHLSDFFIQNVSWDNDQVDYLPNSDSNVSLYKTGWEKTGNNGKNIETADEAKAHKDKDGNSYIVNNNLNEPISYFLDQLGFQDIEGDWTHVNNFNSGNSNFDPENKSSNPNRMIMYVKSAGTENFRCHPSWCTETDWIDSWVLVHLTWIETVKDENSPYTIGTKIPREGYYLGFDFHGKKAGQIVNQDGYYSNWIVKITPGHFNPAGKSRRIFCEDLGGSFDFDFNDAVIDVGFEELGWPNQGYYQPIISVQAAGGTMPIYVEKYKKDYELHRMLGKEDSEDTYKPINVGSTGGSHPIAIYRGDKISSHKASDIHIFVTNTKNGENYKISGGPEDSNGNASSILIPGNSSTLDGNTLTNKTEAPSAFSAPTSVKWLNELEEITKAYEAFPNWVRDHNWKYNGGDKWYEVVKAGAPLFDDTTIKHGTGEFAPPTANGNTNYDEAISWVVLTPDDAEQSVAAATSVHADSYMRVEGYTGSEDKIFARLNNMRDEDRITCTLVLSSATEFNQNEYVIDGEGQYVKNNDILQGILVPADINNGVMSYKNNNFTTENLSRFKNATFVDPNDIKPDDRPANGRHTYTLEFSFKKSDIIKTGSTYHGYLLFFLKVPNYTIGSGSLTDGLGGVKVERWYVHY